MNAAFHSMIDGRASTLLMAYGNSSDIVLVYIAGASRHQLPPVRAEFIRRVE